MRGEDERKCSLALGRQGWRLGLLSSRKLSLRDTPLNRVELRRILSANCVIQCHQDIFSSNKTPLAGIPWIFLFMCKRGCFGFMACDSLSLLALGKIDISIGR
jgi:hypothetical protein